MLEVARLHWADRIELPTTPEVWHRELAEMGVREIPVTSKIAILAASLEPRRGFHADRFHHLLVTHNHEIRASGYPTEHKEPVHCGTHLVGATACRDAIYLFFALADVILFDRLNAQRPMFRVLTLTHFAVREAELVAFFADKRRVGSRRVVHCLQATFPARLCAMNLLLHDIESPESDSFPILPFS